MDESAIEPDQQGQAAFIGRQPIVTRYGELYAYELLYRNSRDNRARIDDPAAATAAVIRSLVTDFGIKAALGPHLGFINVDAEMLAADLLELLPTGKIVLELLETVEITAEVVERCRALRAKGFRFALDDVVSLDPSHLPLLELLDFIKVEVPALDESRLARLTQALRPSGVRLLAEKVDSLEQVQRCEQLGFELFQGYFFARPVIIEGKQFSASETVLMRLFGLVLEDAEIGALEDTFKREPSLSVNLVRLTNSAAMGLPARVTSLRHAITVLGRRQLQRWVQLLLFSDRSGAGGLTTPLMTLAATRARFLELLAARVSKDPQLAERGFLTGILSLLPALFGRPMAELLRELPVDAVVADALLGRRGDLGLLLTLAEELEEPTGRADPIGLARRLECLPESVNTCLGEALAWANNLGT